jgi:hypothetical protein
MKRSPLKRRQALRARSERKVAYDDELLSMRELVLARAMGVCEICRWAPIAHLHHKLRRSQGGTNDLSNLLGVCLDDHEFLHANPAYSYEKGWLVRRSG